MCRHQHVSYMHRENQHLAKGSLKKIQMHPSSPTHSLKELDALYLRDIYFTLIGHFFLAAIREHFACLLLFEVFET